MLFLRMSLINHSILHCLPINLPEHLMVTNFMHTYEATGLNIYLVLQF